MFPGTPNKPFDHRSNSAPLGGLRGRQHLVGQQRAIADANLVDTPDEIVMHPATEYVRKFTEDVDKARVVHARGLSRPMNGTAPEGQPVVRPEGFSRS